jgi:hypothetical protein
MPAWIWQFLHIKEAHHHTGVPAVDVDSLHIKGLLLRIPLWNSIQEAMFWSGGFCCRAHRTPKLIQIPSGCDQDTQSVAARPVRK